MRQIEPSGGKTDTCPVRSVSIAMGASGLMRTIGPFDEYAPIPVATLLNDVTFGDYRVFQSESRILTGNIPRSDR